MSVEYVPFAVLRSAGLPGDLLPAMTDPALVAAVDTAGEADAVRRADDAVAHADRVLTGLCADPAVRRAVAVSHPDLHDNAVVPVADGVQRRRRKRTRAATAVLQRLTTKNDTANGYGPMDRVRLGGEADLVVPAAAGRTDGMVGWWVADLVAAALVRDAGLEPDLRWRLADAVDVDGGELVAGDRRVRLGAPERDALASLPGPPVPGLERLRRAGLVRPDLAAPPACTDPLTELARRLPDTAAGRRWADRLAGLADAARQVAIAAPDAAGLLREHLRRRVEEITGPLPERPRGVFYSDRDVMYAEGRGRGADYRLGGALEQRIRTALDPLCRLAAVHGYDRFLDASLALRSRTGGGRIRLPALMGHVPDLPGASASTADLLARLTDAWTGSGGRLDPARLAELLEGRPVGEPTLLSPDLLLDAGPAGSASGSRLVLGELHANLQVFGLFEHFWPDGELAAWFTGTADLARRTVQFVAPRSQGKAFLCELPTRSIRVSAAALDPDAVGYGRVYVVWDGPVPWLELPDGDRRTLTPADPSNPLYLALSPHTGLLPSWDAGSAHTPELTLGDLVVQRETWRVPRPDVPARSLAEQFVAVRRRRAATGLPERVFVRTADQPKPFHVDFGNPLLVDVLLHWTRPGERLVVTPQDPGPDGLWLERDGRRHCSELRLSAVVR